MVEKAQSTWTRLRNLLPYLCILFLGLFLYKTTISSTSLYGDEWYIFWLGKSAVHNSGNVFSQPSGFVPYTFEIAAFQIMSNIFGYESHYYYLLSFLTRTLASFMLFWFLKRRGLKEFSAFLGSLLFIISPVGVETTDWVRNFDSYLGISLLLFLLDLSLRLKRLRSVLYLWLVFLLGILVNTIRSPGMAIVLTTALMTQWLGSSKKLRKLYRIAVIAIIISVLVLIPTRVFGGQPAHLLEIFSLRPFVYSFIGNLGNTIIPNKGNVFWSFLITTVLLGVLKQKHLLRNNKLSLKFLALLTTGLFVAKQIYSSGYSFNTSFYIGSFFFIFLLVFAVKEIISRDYDSLIITLIIFSLSFSFMVIPLIRIPQIHAESEHRYLIYSALTVPIMTAFAVNSVLINKKANNLARSIFLIFLGILGINYWNQTSLFLKNQNTYHNSNYTKTVWNQLDGYLGNINLNREKVGIILLTTQDNEPKVSNSVYFGFGFHAGLRYSIWDQEMLPPSWLITDNQIDKSKIPPHVISSERKILVFEIAGDKVLPKDITF